MALCEPDGTRPLRNVISRDRLIMAELSRRAWKSHAALPSPTRALMAKTRALLAKRNTPFYANEIGGLQRGLELPCWPIP
jgi:hypothetical protein